MGSSFCRPCCSACSDNILDWSYRRTNTASVIISTSQTQSVDNLQDINMEQRQSLDPNSFEMLILDRDRFLIDLANFIAKMNVTTKSRLWNHRVTLKESDGTKTIQNEISLRSTQMTNFLIDWCVVYTKFLDRGRAPTKVTTVRPHMEQIGLFIFNNWKPIQCDRFISEKCYFSNMLKMYVNRNMECSAGDINNILIECELIDKMNIPHYITNIIAQYMVNDFVCNLHESMVIKLSSEYNHETSFSLTNIFDNVTSRYYRSGNKQWVLLLIKLSTKYHVYNMDGTDNKEQHQQREKKGFIITNIEIVSPLNGENGVNQCMVWIFDDETMAISKYNEINDDHDTEISEREESVSISTKNNRFCKLRDPNKYIIKCDGIRKIEGGKMTKNLAIKGKYVLFKLKNENKLNSCVDIANISIRICRL